MKTNYHYNIELALQNDTDFIGTNQRLNVLQLTAIFVELIGVPWCVAKPDGVKFMLLVVNMACIEMRLTLENKSFKEVCI